MALTEDLSVFLADFGVSVSFTGSTAGMLGIQDLEGVTLLGDDGRAGVSAGDRTVLIRTDQKGSLTQGSNITVNGSTRKVRDIQPFEDGAFSLVRLR